jgi:CYTH domain-containing protein
MNAFFVSMKNTEIERKFLVTSEAFKNEAVRSYEIVQGYLCKEPGKTTRVRIRDAQAFLTIKSGKLRPGIGKFEWEREIDPDDAKELMQLCLPNPIIKTRYIIPITKENSPEVKSDRCWEVDVFHGHKEGLILAELELGDENEPYSRPSWLGEEVTGQPQYYNANM